MSSDNVHFTEIPAGIRKPGVYLEYNTRLANSNLPGNQQKLLIIAQCLAGSVAALTPTRISRDSDAADFFGAGSIAHKMCQVALAENGYLDLTVCALEDAEGSATAVGTVTLTGPATGPGVLDLYVGRQRISVAVANDDSATDLAASLAAAVTGAPDLPVTATALNGVLTLTARNKGTVGNQIDLACLVSAAGVAAQVVAMANGSVDPDLGDALSVVFAGDYDKIVTQFIDDDSLQALRDHLDQVSGPLEARPACGVYAVDCALADAATLAGAINAGRLVGVYLRGTRSPAYEIAAAAASVWAGETDPARPFDGAALVTVSAPPIAERLTRSEQEACLANGVTPLEVGPGEKVQIVRLISTYTKNPQGIADPALLDATTITSLDYGRKAIRQRIAQRFGRGKVTRKTPQAVRTQILDVAYKLQSLEIWDNVDLYKDQLIVEKDLQSVGQLNASIPANVVPGFHVFAGVINLIL